MVSPTGTRAWRNVKACPLNAKDVVHAHAYVQKNSTQFAVWMELHILTNVKQSAMTPWWNVVGRVHVIVNVQENMTRCVE